MPNRIKPKRSYTPNAVPIVSGNTPDIERHELAINWADGKAYTRDANDQLVAITLGGSGGGGTASVNYSYATTADLPATGNSALLYCTTDTGRLWRWTGSVYAEVGPVGGGGGSGQDTELRSYLVPGAPTNLAGTAGNAQVSLSWTAPASAVAITDYVVQYSSNSGSTWTTASDGNSTATSATVTGLTNGTAYTFRVAAVNGIGQGAWSTVSSSVTPGGDPYFANVSLLLHCNGSNGSTGITDSSANAFSVTRGGDAQISTSQSKFGGSSLYLDGNGDYIITPAASAFNFGSGDFTIELWLRFASLSGGQRIAGGDVQSGGTYNWAIYKAGGSSTLQFLMGDGGSPWNMGNANFGSVAADQWYHVAIVRNGNTFTGYLDGIAGGAFSSSGSLVTNNSNGAFFGYATGDYFNGYMDEIRITKGVARYTANFTPIAFPFPDA